MRSHPAKSMGSSQLLSIHTCLGTVGFAADPPGVAALRVGLLASVEAHKRVRTHHRHHSEVLLRPFASPELIAGIGSRTCNPHRAQGWTRDGPD
jgi:hypothetical protein